MPAPPPVTGHAILEQLVGLWDTVTRMSERGPIRPVEIDGSVEKAWVLGGLFLREDLAGVDAEGQPHMGLGFLGYNELRGVFQAVWMNTGSDAMVFAEGELDASGRCIVLDGDEPDPGGGAPRRFRTVIRILGPDRHVVSHGYAGIDANGHPTFELAFEISHSRA